MTTRIEEKFSNYFEKWMSQNEEYLQLLLSASRDKPQEAEHEALVSKLTSLHKDYYTVKWAAAHEDVLAFFTPVWLSPLENAYLWVSGWKPSMVFRLIDSLRKSESSHDRSSLSDLSEEQNKSIECLRGRIRMEEEKVEREMERQQVPMGDRRMVELARLASRVKCNEQQHPAASQKVEREMERQQVAMGDRRMVELARLASRVKCNELKHPAASQVDRLVEMTLRGLMEGLERVMKMADCVRLKTLKGVLDVLSPVQSVDFLTAFSVLQIRVRKWGKKRENRCNQSS